jgi:pimeloyl-ACP methyl ester carboxylesterase
MLTLLATLASAATCLAQSPIAGDWQGVLDTGMSKLHLVLHISNAVDGSISATMESVDQSSKVIPVTAISFKDSKLSFRVESIHATYQGRVNRDATDIDGEWSQRQQLPLAFKRAKSVIKAERRPAPPSDIDGTWMGALDTGAIKLRIVFHVINTGDGLTATMDSPDQNMKGFPASVTRQDSGLKIAAGGIGATFDGTISKDLNTIEGTWSQGGGSLPLVLQRVKDQSGLERRRPQNPVEPYPYRVEEVTYKSAQDVTLAATLTIPQDGGPFSAVLLIPGSGPQDRDETVMGHKPFLVLADYLTRQGIAVLRADDRGVGKSTGSFATATTADFATDAEAGLKYLKTRSEFDPHKIGLIGHSEGGIVAPMVAVRDPNDVAFIVLMAGPGVRGDEILTEQVLLIGEATGKSREQAAKDAAEEREILGLVEGSKNDATLDKALRKKLAGEESPQAVTMEIKQVTTPWFRYFISYDPAGALRNVKCPLLALNGEKDLQVSPEHNLPAIRKALEGAGNTNFEIDELPGLNHLFQTAKTGAPSDYAAIEETISPVALQKIASWIQTQCAAPSLVHK